MTQIEAGLGVALPDKVRSFMLERSEELANARDTLHDEVVLEASAKAIVRLNRTLRKRGIETGDDARPAPWPLEYLALSDNGAGDHECIKLTEKTGAIYEFDGEAGRFSREFSSLDAYLVHLRRRLVKFQKSPKGKSDPKLLKRAPALFSDGRALKVLVKDVKPPVTASSLRAAGIDLKLLRYEYAALLEGVTGIPR